MNLTELLSGYSKNLKSIAEKPIDNDIVDIVEILVEDIVTRIKKGDRNDGLKIGKYNKKYRGKYSNRRVSKYSNWSIERKKKNLQTNYVDFSYTGGLLESMYAKRMDDGSIIISYRTAEDKRVAEELDEMYFSDGDIFLPSKEEQDRAGVLIIDSVIKRLTNITP